MSGFSRMACAAHTHQIAIPSTWRILNRVMTSVVGSGQIDSSGQTDNSRQAVQYIQIVQ